MVPDELSTPRWNRFLHTAASRFPVPLWTFSSPRSNGRSVILPVVVVLALAISVAVVPAIGSAAGVGIGADSASVAAEACDGLSLGAGSDHGATTTSLRTTSAPIDTIGGSTTHVGAVDLQSSAAEGPAGTIVAVIESLAGESIVFLGAYSRYGDGSPLEHPIRSEIDALVSRLPGVQFTSAVDAVDASESTVRYHTQVLEHEDVVQTATVWGTQRLFPVETDTGHFEALAAVRDDSRSAVLQAIDRNDPATVTTIAEAVDRAPSTVSHHLSALESADLIDRERVGQSVHVSLVPGVSELLDAEADVGGVGVDATALELVGD